MRTFTTSDGSTTCDTSAAPVATPLVRSTPTHLVVSRRAITGLLSALTTLGVVLGGIGLRDAYHRLPTDGDRVLSVAIVVAATAVAATFYIGLAHLPRRGRRT